MPEAPEVIELTNRNLSCTIVPALGGAVTRLDVLRRGQNIPVLYPTPAGATDPREFSLVHIAPIGGPVRGNSFKLDGKPYLLEPNFPDEPLYRNGIAWQRPWTGRKDGKTSATLKYMHQRAPGWPFDFSLTAILDLEEDNLSISYELVNETKQSLAPIGFGTSILLPRPWNVLLSAGISAIWQPDDTGVPFTTSEVPYNLDLKEGLSLNGLSTPERWFSGWTGRATLDYADSKLSITLKTSEPLRHLGLACGDKSPFLRLTPLSHVPGALSIKDHDEDETGRRVLGPGDALSARVVVDVNLGLY